MANKNILKVMMLEIEDSGLNSLAKGYLESLSNNNFKVGIGVEFYTKTILIDDLHYKVQFWVLSHIERLASQISAYSYFRGALGGIILISSIDIRTMVRLRELLKDVRYRWINKNIYFPIYLALNIDKIKKLSVEQIKNLEEFVKISEINGYTQISVNSGSNIDDLFIGLTKLIVKSRTKNDIER